jgi:hypothetical protein
MNQKFKGAAKRLLFSLLAASSLAGCAGYGPPYDTDESYYDTFSPGYVEHGGPQASE